MSKRIGYFTSGALLVSALLSSLGCGGGAGGTVTITYRPNRADSLTIETSSDNATGTTESSSGGATAGGVGTLKGRILYGGTFSPLSPLYTKGNAPKDSAVCGAEAAPNQTILVNDGGLANVFIYLDKVPKGVEIPKSEAASIEFDQKHCVFKPHAMLMRVGETVKVLNSDPVLHNTHTKPERNNEFNQSVNQTGATLVYTRPEKKPLAVVCDIHPWMIAYHLPLDHPFAAVTDENGNFEIPNLPSGKLEFKIWHEAGKELEKAYKVEIKPGETKTIEYTVAPSKLSP